MTFSDDEEDERRRRLDIADLFRHQLALIVGLLRQNPGSNQNQLHSPLALTAGVVHLGHQANHGVKNDLSRLLLDPTDPRDRIGNNRLFGELVRSVRRTNSKAIHFDNRLYYQPNYLDLTTEKPMDHRKLDWKYAITAKKLLSSSSSLLDRNTSKPDLSTLEWINRDFSDSDADPKQTADSSPPMLRVQDYVALVGPNTRAIACAELRFRAPWSKPFATEAGLFTTGTGVPIKTTFLHRTKHYQYWNDTAMAAKVVSINFSHKSGHLAALVLVLPDTPLDSMDTFVRDWLTPLTLENALDRLRKRRVRLRFPQFQLHSSVHLSAPVGLLTETQSSVPARERRSPTWKPKRSTEPPTVPVALDQQLSIAQQYSLELGVDGTGPESDPTQPDKFDAEFNADRPFLFLVVNHSSVEQMVILAGVINDPRLEQC